MMIETEHRVSHSEARFRYVYDDRGNWIEKIVEARHGTDGNFHHVEHRAAHDLVL